MLDGPSFGQEILWETKIITTCGFPRELCGEIHPFAPKKYSCKILWISRIKNVLRVKSSNLEICVILNNNKNFEFFREVPRIPTTYRKKTPSCHIFLLTFKFRLHFLIFFIIRLSLPPPKVSRQQIRLSRRRRNFSLSKYFFVCPASAFSPYTILRKKRKMRNGLDPEFNESIRPLCGWGGSI